MAYVYLFRMIAGKRDWSYVDTAGCEVNARKWCRPGPLLRQFCHETGIFELAALQREVLMPQFDFCCETCGQTFSKSLTVDEYQEGGIICPNCGREKVERRFSPVFRAVHNKTDLAS